jgi:Flp pilus assembly protein TadD
MKLTKGIFVLSLLFLFNCQNKNSTPDPDLASIDFLRGDLALCGGTDFGEVEFMLSCNYATRETFNLAISLLHSFEYEEAEKAFVKVIDEDPNCPMAYWGVLNSIYHTIWFEPSDEVLMKGSKILEIAEKLPKTEREKDYLDAIGAFYKDWDKVDHKTREKRMELKMEENYLKYPDDKEAAIFYALALKSTADRNDKTYASQRKAGKILESIFPDQPSHPGIAHYIIHNYDNPELAHLALSPARKYAEIAPSSAHALHMPSHIFTRLGLWDESISSNVYSAAAAKCYAMEVEMDGVWANEIHAMDYLVYAYLQKGDNANAIKQQEYLQSIYNINPHNIPAIAYPFAAIPSRIALENKHWQEASDLEIHSSEVNWDLFPWQKSILHYARALGSSRIKDLESAKAEIDTLELLREELLKNKSDYYASQVMIEIKSAQAWLQLSRGNNTEAVALMREASDLESNTEKHGVTPGEVLPARELLGDMLLELNQPKMALEEYELNLIDRPNRFNGIYGAAIASDQLGDRDKTRKYFQMLLDFTEGSNSDRPEVTEALKYLEDNRS